MKLHNLGAVIGFELRRTLTKPTYWAATLGVPLLMVFVFWLMFFSQTAAFEDARAAVSAEVTFTYSDASGVVEPSVAQKLGGTLASDADAARQAVRDGRADLHIDVPADPARQPTLATGRDVGLVESGRWAAVAQRLVVESAQARIGDPMLAALAKDAPTQVEVWRAGQLSPGFSAMIAPGFFLVLFYLAIVMLGQQMLNITVEEKENRVTEMILTTINPTVLIVGKVIAVVLVGIVQAVVLLTPVLIWALLPTSSLPTSTLPPEVIPTEATASLTRAPVLVPGAIAMGAALFIGGFMMFTGLLVAIGSVMPTAKDAGGAFAAVLIAMLLPVYAGSLLVTSPGSPISLFMTYFPLTSPISALVRNAVGNLGLLEGVIVLIILYGCALAFLYLGVRLFREGSISYDLKLNPFRTLRR